EVRRWPRMVELLGDARQPGRARARSDARDTSLDTTLLSDFENQPIDVEDPAKKVTKGRAPPLLDLPLDMDPQEWKRILKTRRVKQRSFRKLQLAERYPHAWFCLLNDDVWNYDAAQEWKRKRDAWRHSKRERDFGVSFIDGAHCPKCAARLYSFTCPHCL